MAKHEINPFRNILKDINFKKSQLRTQAKAVQADCSHTHKGKKNGKPTGDKKTGAPCAHSIPMSESNLPPVERDAIIINEKGEECDASALERV